MNVNDLKAATVLLAGHLLPARLCWPHRELSWEDGTVQRRRQVGISASRTSLAVELRTFLLSDGRGVMYEPTDVYDIDLLVKNVLEGWS